MSHSVLGVRACPWQGLIEETGSGWRSRDGSRGLHAVINLIPCLSVLLGSESQSSGPDKTSLPSQLPSHSTQALPKTWLAMNWATLMSHCCSYIALLLHCIAADALVVPYGVIDANII